LDDSPDQPTTEVGSTATGTCERTNSTFGCVAVVNNGVITETVCTD
jgi:hypothetical protein